MTESRGRPATAENELALPPETPAHGSALTADSLILMDCPVSVSVKDWVPSPHSRSRTEEASVRTLAFRLKGFVPASGGAFGGVDIVATLSSRPTSQEDLRAESVRKWVVEESSMDWTLGELSFETC